MNELTIRFLCSNLIKDEILDRALTFWLAFFAQFLYVFFKSNLIINVYPRKFFTARTWKLITNIHLMNFFITKKKVKSIWIHFHTVILKPQRKAFRQSLNFINYFRFWTTHGKWSVIICLTYQVDISYKQNEITKKDIKKQWTQYGTFWYSV